MNSIGARGRGTSFVRFKDNVRPTSPDLGGHSTRQTLTAVYYMVLLFQSSVPECLSSNLHLDAYEASEVAKYN